MYKLNLNELAALQLVFEYIPVKDLLVSAMHHLAECEDLKSQDSADTISKALTTFLR